MLFRKSGEKLQCKVSDMAAGVPFRFAHPLPAADPHISNADNPHAAILVPEDFPVPDYCHDYEKPRCWLVDLITGVIDAARESEIVEPIDGTFVENTTGSA